MRGSRAEKDKTYFHDELRIQRPADRLAGASRTGGANDSVEGARPEKADAQSQESRPGRQADSEDEESIISQERCQIRTFGV
jgi:hypothetical protein